MYSTVHAIVAFRTCWISVVARVEECNPWISSNIKEASPQTVMLCDYHLFKSRIHSTEIFWSFGDQTTQHFAFVKTQFKCLIFRRSHYRWIETP